MSEMNDEQSNNTEEGDNAGQPLSATDSGKFADLLSTLGEPLADIVAVLLRRNLEKSQVPEEMSDRDIEEITDQLKDIFRDFSGSSELQAAIDRESGRDQIGSRSAQIAGFDDDHVDFDAVHPIKRVLNEEAFMGWLFEYVAEDSIWVIDHELAENQISFLRQFEVEDDIEVASAAIYPPRGTLRIRLDSHSKTQITARLPDLGVGWEIVHQHVYSRKQFYLTTYDCFSYVGLSLAVPAEEIRRLEAAQIVTLSG